MISKDILREVERHIRQLKRDWSQHYKYYEFIRKQETAKLATKAIREYYGDAQLYTLSNTTVHETIPVFTEEDWNVVQDIDSVLSNLQLLPDEDIDSDGLSRCIEDAVFNTHTTPENVEIDVEDYIWTTPGYALSEIHSNGPSFNFKLTDYLTTVSQTGKLYYELFDALYTSQTTSADGHKHTQIDLPYRESEADEFSTILNFDTHQRILKTSTVVLFNTGDGYVMPIIKKHPTTFNYPNWYSNIPTGEFQYITAPQDEFSLRHSILKQYGEGIFSQDVSRDGIYTHNAMSELQRLLGTGDATLQYTGCCVNAIDTEYILTAVLIIDDPKYIDSFVFNPNNDYGTFELIPFSPSTPTAQLENILTHPQVLPETKFAIDRASSCLSSNTLHNE